MHQLDLLDEVDCCLKVGFTWVIFLLLIQEERIEVFPTGMFVLHLDWDQVLNLIPDRRLELFVVELPIKFLDHVQLVFFLDGPDDLVVKVEEVVDFAEP